MAKFLGVGWQFPVTAKSIDDDDHKSKRFALAEYEESVRQSILIILKTAKGERVMRPDFGCDLHDLVFAPNNATTRGLAESYVEEAMLLWEPRIKVLDIAVHPAGEQGEVLNINIEYMVRTTDNRFNLVYPFYLDRGAV
jgi:hypothetical protein